MTISTMFWTSNGTGDGPLAGHGTEISRRMFRHLHISDPTVQGVINTNENNQLAMSHSTASEIDVATGSAFVYGAHVNSDAVETLTLAGVAADTAGIVVVGIDWTGGITGTAQTGFIRAVQQTSGNTTFPSPTQTDLTSWEIEIGRYIVDSSGNVWTGTGKGTAGVLDTRRWIGKKNITHFVQPFYASNSMVGSGANLPDAATHSAGVNFQIPNDYISNFTIKAVVSSSSSGNISAQTIAGYGGCGESSTSHDSGVETISITANQFECIQQDTIAGVARGDFMTASFLRFGAAGADTLADDLIFHGFAFEYVGYDG